MADTHSTAPHAPRAAEYSEGLKHDVSRLANDLEHTCEAMGRLAVLAQQMTADKIDPERAALLWSIDKLALYSVGVAGAIARRVGSREVGTWSDELQELAPPPQ